LHEITDGVIEEYKKMIDYQVKNIKNKNNYEKIKSINTITNLYKIFFILDNKALLLCLENLMQDVFQTDVFWKEYYLE
jgi:hypothetical protein